MGLLPLLVGQPFHQPRQPFCGAVRVYGNTRVEQHPRMANCVYRRLRQAPILLPDWLSTAQPEPAPARGARQFCALRSSLAPSRRVFASLVTLPFHLLCFCAKPIAAGSVCEDSEAVAAATRRIRAAFRRGARIAINSCAHGCSTTKAIKAAPPLSGRTGDGASRRDSRKSLPVVRYRNASWR